MGRVVRTADAMAQQVDRILGRGDQQGTSLPFFAY
jgi:hypothetical protein